MVGIRKSLEGFNWPSPKSNGSELSIHQILEKSPEGSSPLSQQVIDCLSVWNNFLGLFDAAEKLPSFPIWSMEFGATYPYDKDSLSRVPLQDLRRAKGCFGQPLSRLDRTQIYDRVPSHARGPRGVFPRWKKQFIKQNREFFEKHREKIEPWLTSIMRFPPSLQKLEWNCQGELRDIWKYVIQFRASGVRVKRPNTSPSLVAMTSTQIPIIAWERRYMTVHECARLQSMGELKHFPVGLPAMRALGNAVNVRVVEGIISNLVSLLALQKPETTLSRRRVAKASSNEQDTEGSCRLAS